MRIEITDQAVFVLDLSDEDRRHLEHVLRRAGGKSLIIARRPRRSPALGDEEELAVLIESLRTSAQDTLAALKRRGYRLIKSDPAE